LRGVGRIWLFVADSKSEEENAEKSGFQGSTREESQTTLTPKGEGMVTSKIPIKKPVKFQHLRKQGPGLMDGPVPRLGGDEEENRSSPRELPKKLGK